MKLVKVTCIDGPMKGVGVGIEIDLAIDGAEIKVPDITTQVGNAYDVLIYRMDVSKVAGRIKKSLSYIGRQTGNNG